MSLADLEFDYINPYDSTSRINKVVLPEYFTLGGLCCFYLLTGHWIMSLFCAPYVYYNVRLAYPKPIGLAAIRYWATQVTLRVSSLGREGYRQGKHLVDVTEIFNMLASEKKQRLFKLFYLIFILFLSLFWLIYTSLDDDYD
ncbi:hypothetical protein TSUD_184520 [Trifolium subterraneum]|uniref:Uncharacterized protein n=1 Tax=Trifolium subterraneum TaxID=3900 RepID=A0A2Z6NQY8_TRISU|nr:hypothetical protein TSUD_184520 [Trifolium subterraneum]